MNVIQISATSNQLIPDHTDAGQQYEHLCTELVIRLEEELIHASKYRLLFELPSGRCFTTEDLPLLDDKITFLLPKILTTEYGSINVQLRVFEDEENGWRLKYTPIITPPLYISKSIKTPLDKIPQDEGKDMLEDVTMLVKLATESADTSVQAAEQAEASANSAAEFADEAASAARRAEEAAGTVLDGFSEAFDELHAYAQGLVSGGGAE